MKFRFLSDSSPFSLAKAVSVLSITLTNWSSVSVERLWIVLLSSIMNISFFPLDEPLLMQLMSSSFVSFALFRSWIFECRFKSPLTRNRLPQTGHTNGFSPSMRKNIRLKLRISSNFQFKFYSITCMDFPMHLQVWASSEFLFAVFTLVIPFSCVDAPVYD